ncbi:MAG: Calx-beta domain-containing protein, partial [Actinomycetota bacterium]
GDASTKEGPAGTKTTLMFPVSLSFPPTGAVTIDYRTTDGSATHGSDYEGIVGSLIIPAAQLVDRIDVNVFGDDRFEPDETFTLEITGIVGAQQGSNGTGTILNDDRAATSLTLHVHVRDRRDRSPSHRVAVRGRLINGAAGLPLQIVLMCEHGSRWVVVDRAMLRTRRKPHVLLNGETAFGYRSAFNVTRGGRYRVRVVFRGDTLRARALAHRRFRI